MKILYCTDFTDASLYSLERAIPFLKPDAAADIISVIEIGFLVNLAGYPSAYTEYLEACKENKIKNLEKIKLDLEAKGLKVKNLLYPQGDPADAIVRQLEKEDYDLIIAGAHTKKFLGKWLGSTSRKIAIKSHIPIFITRKRKEGKTVPEKPKVLFAVDGTENSYNSIRKTLDILNLKNSATEVLYIKSGKESLPPEIISDREWLQKILEKEKEFAREILDKASSIAEEKGIKFDLKTVLEGSPAEEILDYTKKNEKDLIVMGSHGREGISSLLLGSISKRVLDNTYCPVLIVPVKRQKISAA